VIGWSRTKLEPCEPYLADSIDVMSVGNLPNELPKDASEEFGEMLSLHIIPALFAAQSRLLEEATITRGGKLTAHFEYLSDFVQESD
jgi:saccharopine dehydrogenase (NAD+, L-lysine-forming)